MKKFISLIIISLCMASSIPVFGECTYNNPIHKVVNKTNGLEPTYVPNDLVIPRVPFSFTGHHEKKLLQQDAAIALEELFMEAENQNIKLYAVSGYRSYDRQKQIYEENVKKHGVAATNKVSAKPGHSEHQTGLAMDVSCRSIGFELTQRFGDTIEGKWVAENSHKYGFILSYPKGKEHITGYIYEPWHIRFVGKDLATYLYENNLILEELDDCEYLETESEITQHQTHVDLVFQKIAQAIAISGIKTNLGMPPIFLNSIIYTPTYL